jgi:hypothetical protein
MTQTIYACVNKLIIIIKNSKKRKINLKEKKKGLANP